MISPLKGLDAAQTKGKSPAPVHLWNPPFCGDIDMHISADGIWHYMKSPIGRKPLVSLFASVLRKEGDAYFLVTPVEKCGLTVEDAPFTAVRMAVAKQRTQDQVISFETNVDDEVTVDETHPLRFAEEPGTGGLKPYVMVRAGLEALVTRALYYDLVALGETDAQGHFGLWSSGMFWRMQNA
jgi:uncharacterized protein